MSDSAEERTEQPHGREVANGWKLGMVLLCFDSRSRAASARRDIEKGFVKGKNVVLDSVVLRVNGKGHVSIYDPRRVVAGTLTAFVTWGLFGLVAGGLKGLAIWAILGAVCGGLWAYFTEHLLKKNELVRIGTQLPTNSSSLLIFSQTADAHNLLEACAIQLPTTGSAIEVDEDFSARSFAGVARPLELPNSAPGSAHSPSRSAPVSMALLRYADPGAAATVAGVVTPKSKKTSAPVQVELIVRIDENGRRRVIDPTQGTAAWAKSDVVSWGLFGVVVGALAGAFGGGGVHGFVDDAVVTGIGWAVFGLVAGALYGLWAGRAVSARRLKGLHGLLRPGTSYLVGWIDGSAPSDSLDALSKGASGELIVNFNPVTGGAVLEAA